MIWPCRLRPLRLSFPYGALARAYDDVMGRSFFRQVRRIFERIVARHRIAFSSAADLGCGTGLFARYLSSLWRVPVFGVDLSPAMLRVAASNCSGGPVTLLRQDIRLLRLPRRVDLVTANYDMLNHLVNEGELPALFRRIHRQLNPGGHFIFDFITPCNPLNQLRLCRRRSRDGRRHVTHRLRWIPSRRMLLYRVVVREPQYSAGHVELHRERAYWPQEIAAWLSDAGFILRDVLDWTTMRRATRCHGRIVVVAQRPG